MLFQWREALVGGAVGGLAGLGFAVRGLGRVGLFPGDLAVGLALAGAAAGLLVGRQLTDSIRQWWWV